MLKSLHLVPLSSYPSYHKEVRGGGENNIPLGDLECLGILGKVCLISIEIVQGYC